MKMEMKNRSHRYDINRHRSRHGHKCSNNCDKSVSIWWCLCLLTHFQPMFYFYPPWKHQQTGGFFSGGMEMEHWLKIG